MSYTDSAPQTPMLGAQAQVGQPPKEKPEKRQWSDEELLDLVLKEQQQSVGFENDWDLTGQRIRALEYSQGVMRDSPAPKNRSSAMSSDVSDGIETVLPDLIEIFTGEDVATFQPQNEADEQAAEQETDYIRHVVMEQNDGFLILYTAYKDALQSKVGVFRWYWEEWDDSTEEVFEGKDPQDLMLAVQDAQANPAMQVIDVDPDEANQTVSFKVTTDGRGGKCCVVAVNPVDFSVARDTVRLADTTYCCMRSRPRAQELVARGYDADKVSDLPAYSSISDQAEIARDTVSELTTTPYASDAMLRTVEVVEHNIRLVDDDGKEHIYRVISGGLGEQGVILDIEEIDRIQFSAVTPYPQTHRFYGRSLADLLMEIQKIKTALLRMFLDSGYFALNQRYEVAESSGGANEFTYGDLIRNEPGVPVRSKSGNAVRPITAGGLNFDVPEAMEFISTMAEQRTGVVRNAQGLNPDTLHDTASGAMALMSAAQRRVRMIARIFAETGVKDMFLGVHALLRAHAEKAQVAKLRGSWVPIDPTQWGERTAMSIDIGVGSGGQAQEMQAMNAAIQLTQTIVQEQGGLKGPLVTADNVFALVSRFYTKALKLKTADPYITDPKVAEAQQQGQPQQPPPPDPKMTEVQGKLSLQQQEMQSDQQLQAQRLQADQQKAQADAANQMQLGQAKIASEARLAREKMANDMQLQREQAAIDREVKLAEIAADERVKMQESVMRVTQTAQMPGAGIGGQPGGEVGGNIGGGL